MHLITYNIIKIIKNVQSGMSISQILSHTEDPTEIMFSRGILSAVEGGTEGYSESTSGQLATALKIAQDAYNSNIPYPQ